MKHFLALFFISNLSWAAEPGLISEYNFRVTDIARKGLKKEVMFSKMERSMLNLEDSICSNRAQLWAYDLQRNWGINPGKIFIFFTESIWKKDKKGWMYHVAPYIVENDVEYVMEASYNDVPRPMTVEEWAENETYNRIRGEECLLIGPEDTDLTEYFYERKILPEKRTGGRKGAKCYIRKVPGYYWFPASIAYHELKMDEDGKAVSYDPKKFEIEDVLDACIEATAPKLSRIFSNARGKCKKYLGVK